MSEKDVQDHFTLLRETGKHKLSIEQEDTIRQLMNGVMFDLEEDLEPTMDLPILARRK